MNLEIVTGTVLNFTIPGIIVELKSKGATAKFKNVDEIRLYRVGYSLSTEEKEWMNY